MITQQAIAARVVVGFLGATAVSPLAADVRSRGTDLGSLRFIANCGQWATTARFIAQARNVSAHFEDAAIRIQIRNSTDVDSNADTVSFRMRMKDALPGGTLEGEEPAPGVYNFLRGSDPSRWRRGVPHYKSLLYRSVYDGIDMRVRGAEAGNAIEYDLLVSPGAEIEQIEFECEGIDGLYVDATGRLVIETPGGAIAQSAPVAWWEEADGERRPVRCGFRILNEASFGFELSEIEPELRLVIDPVLELGAQFGGLGEDWATSVVATETGDLLVAGESQSFWSVSDVSELVDGAGGAFDCFLVKLSGSGELIYWTYFGGSADDFLASMIQTEHGLAVSGHTQSGDFPVSAGAFDTTNRSLRKAYLTILNEAGDELVYSTFIGGSGEDVVAEQCLDVNQDGCIFVAGSTSSQDFPVSGGAFGESHAGGRFDLFLAVIDPTLRGEEQLVYSTYIGGPGEEADPDIGSRRTQVGLTLLPTGSVCVVGGTTSPFFPQSLGQRGGRDAFVVEIVPDGTLRSSEQLVYATGIGGSGPEVAYAVKPHPRGGVMVIGWTFSSNFPVTAGAFDTTHGSPGSFNDLFIAHILLDSRLSQADQMPYSTFFGGSSFEVAYDLEFDARETLTFCGRSGSPNLPLTSDAIEGVSGGFDAILVQLQPDLGLPPTDQLVYSTYYRGSANEYFFDIALEDSGRITAVGASQSGTMPRAGEAFEHEFSNWSIIVAGFSADIRKSFLRGDCNDDGTVNISDAACILNWLFAGEDDPGCVAATNTNGDEAANITDATYLLNHLFAGGPAPVAPFPDCGPGTLPQELSCEDPPDCP